MSIILSLAGDGISDDLLARQGYRQVARISGKVVVRIFGTRNNWVLAEDGGQPFCDSPLMVDCADNGATYQLTSPLAGVVFDLNADGVADRVSWTQPNAETALLALDRNHNGRIDNGSELFGNHTALTNGSIARNGFEALLDLDGGIQESDGQITPSDPAYFDLRLWRDRNHDGVSQPEELLSLADSGITAIFTAYEESKHRDRFGNRYRYEGIALVVDRSGNIKRRRLFDVYLLAITK